MNNKLIRPAALVLYPLSFIACFLLGAFVTKWSGAAEGQGLAAGAIVIYYAVLSSVIGTMISFIVAYLSPSKLIAKINWVLLIALTLMIAVLAYQIRQKKYEKDIKEPVRHQKTTLPQNMIVWGSFTERTKNFSAPKAGLGLFKPHFENNSVLYLYNPPHPDDHLPDAPVDSISFQLDGMRNPSIKSAPPYLVAEHMKLDYGILFFKVRTQSPFMLELELNKSQGKTMWVEKAQGEFMYWPDFLMQVHSVELKHENITGLRAKPLDHAAVSSQQYSYLHPIALRQEWMKVELLSDDYRLLGTAWCKWMENGHLMINYNLLS